MKRILLLAVFALVSLGAIGQIEKSERYSLGLDNLNKIDGEAGAKVVESLDGIFPDMGRYLLEYAFGDVYSNTNLDVKSKEVAAVASLVALGTIPQLEVHLNAAFNSGCSIIEVKELILQMSVYVGFPKALNGMYALKRVLDDRRGKGISDVEGQIADAAPVKNRLEYGGEMLSRLDKKQVSRLQKAYGELSPELVNYILEYGYADVFSRNSFSKRNRQIATIAALAALGNAQPQLEFHINGGLNIGLKAEEIKEIMLVTTVYAGFPAAINGTSALKHVLETRNMVN